MCGAVARQQFSQLCIEMQLLGSNFPSYGQIVKFLINLTDTVHIAMLLFTSWFVYILFGEKDCFSARLSPECPRYVLKLDCLWCL